ncbi:hypothetical protein DFR50_11362 [Roseiarcus fermentans]|uniref:Uncharacterized protein n=1 Tax=Roseiarcus fermentans TaxID=1473586 RepID=A0A366FDW8_9HYPH|nr:hypothetical protein DFR50_11362 [Roseiarcus fermentans]
MGSGAGRPAFVVEAVGKRRKRFSADGLCESLHEADPINGIQRRDVSPPGTAEIGLDPP